MPINRRIFCLEIGAVFASLNSLAQQLTPATALRAPIPIPADRADDSYTIYSLLVPILQPTKKEYLVADTTEDPSKNFGARTPTVQTKPPLAAIELLRSNLDPMDVPDDWNIPFQEAVADYQLRKGERVMLEAKLSLALPYRLMNDEQVSEYRLLTPPHVVSSSHPWPPDPKLVKKYKGRGPLSLMSEVYFDRAYTLGLVWAVSGCNVNWYAFEKRDGRWIPAAWKDWGSCVGA